MPVVKIAVKYSLQGTDFFADQKQYETMIIDLLKTGKMTIRIFKILAPRLRKLSLEAITAFHA